jgi:hypothetical protein
MSDLLQIEGKSLVPRDIVAPGAFSEQDKEKLCDAMNRILEKNGVLSHLQYSMEANISEFSAKVEGMFGEIRNDIQPYFYHVINDLTRTAEKMHLDFLNAIDTSLAKLVAEADGLRAELEARKKLEEYKEQLDREHNERRKRLEEEIEKQMLDIVRTVQKGSWESDPLREEFTRKMEAVAKENGKLRVAISDAYRATQDIGLFSIKKARDRILAILGRHL